MQNTTRPFTDRVSYNVSESILRVDFTTHSRTSAEDRPKNMPGRANPHRSELSDILRQLREENAS